MRPDFIQEKIALAGFTSWQVGGPAEYLARPRTLDDVRAAVQWAQEQKLTVTVLGGGTNSLVSDAGVRGLVLVLDYLTGVEIKIANDRLCIEAWAGTSKSELLKLFLKYKLTPAIFLAGLPGDIGGGIVMNAGVGENLSPREFVEITDWVEVLRTEQPGLPIERLTAEQLQWRYRHCQGWQPGVIVRVGLSWPNEPDPNVLLTVREANRARLSKQPLDLPSCGSVFVNPPGGKAGQLIESSGLKGFTVGGAKVSEKHANFIVNFNRATAQDIHQVIQTVQRTVLDKQGVQLHTEVVYLGHW